MTTDRALGAGQVTANHSQTPVTPEPIMRIASGFMAARFLFAANEIGLFEALADAAASIDELATRLNIPRRTMRITADAMVALGLLESTADRYRNSEVAATFLAGRTPADLRPFLRFWDGISYPAWLGLADALRTGVPQTGELDAATQTVFLAGVEAITAGPARALAGMFDFSTHQRLLDIGGGTGSWSITAARAHPHLRATVHDLPAVVGLAAERIATAGLAARVTTVAGDMTSEALPVGHDVALLANVVHYWSPEQNRALLRRVRDAVDIGGHLLLADFWTDATHTQPVIAALMAGEFTLQLPCGDVYSVDEVRGWLEATGWRLLEHAQLAGPFSLVVAEAV
jgi:SAM-dependent methyltransferase